MTRMGGGTSLHVLTTKTITIDQKLYLLEHNTHY